MRYLIVVALLALTAFADPATVTLRGRLRQQPGQAPSLETAEHKRVILSGDESTLKVLNDARLKDADFEVLGHFMGAARFEVNPIHLASLFLYQNGKRMQVSYWCDVCYIRTSSPGKCWCCQKETDLNPVEPEH